MMYQYRVCPKCSHVRQDTETTDPGVCSACGLIFARYGEAAERGTTQRRTTAPASGSHGGARFVSIALLLIALAGGVYWYRSHKHLPHDGSFATVALPAARQAGRIEQREFAELFDAGTPFSDLAEYGHYTVVEVYLDECAYCRELEAALNPFREKRQDVALVRVHHPGRMSMNVHGNSREEMQRQADLLNTRMKSYALCGSPHVEVYGPDRKLLAADGCGEHAGTALLWNWIGSETGITRKSGSGEVTRM